MSRASSTISTCGLASSLFIGSRLIPASLACAGHSTLQPGNCRKLYQDTQRRELCDDSLHFWESLETNCGFNGCDFKRRGHIMKRNHKAALFVGIASILTGTGLAFAQMDGPPPPDGPMQGLMHREGGRLDDRLLAEFDLNHDGKITHTEYNTVIANRYSKAV